MHTDDTNNFKYSTLFLSVYSCWQKYLSQLLKKIPNLFFSSSTNKSIFRYSLSANKHKKMFTNIYMKIFYLQQNFWIFFFQNKTWGLNQLLSWCYCSVWKIKSIPSEKRTAKDASMKYGGAYFSFQLLASHSAIT